MLRLNFLKCVRNHLHKKCPPLNIFPYREISPQNLTYSKLENIRKLHSLTSKVRNRLHEFEKEPEGSLTEAEFVAQLKNDPDNFGNRPEMEPEVVDEGDIMEERRFTDRPPPSKKLSTKQYADIIKDLLKKRKIKEAIDVLEVRMLKEDQVKPENYIYNLLLGGCGRVGYTKKAFSLFNNMKKRGLKVHPGAYTALFNACANSPWPLTDGLTRAKHLREMMIEKQYDPNDTNYNAMIKAFGRCGDLPTAFTLVDEMIEKRFIIADDTINFLLQACITDKEAGFRHALLVWRKLVQKKIRPSVYTYNLMLRCIRDCGLGDLETTTDVINKLLQDENVVTPKQLSEVKLIEDKKVVKSEDRKQKKTVEPGDLDKQLSEVVEYLNEEHARLKAEANQIQVVNKDENEINTVEIRPNLMANVPYLGNIISLSEVTKAEDRLILVGGSTGFLQNMEEHECKPDIKTFTQLLDTIPSTIEAEKELLSYMKKRKFKPDIDFFNMLIKKRSMRSDYEAAKNVVKLIRKVGYYPDLVTYGVLALGCKTQNDALELLETMKTYGYRLNAEILGAMLHQACYNFNFHYVLEIMEICKRENVQPNKKFFEHLNKFYNVCKEQSNKKEFSDRNEKMFIIFKKRYKQWRTEVQPDDSEDAHPWQQYRQETKGNEKYFKTKDTARFKQRLASRFKVKTSLKHRAKL